MLPRDDHDRHRVTGFVVYEQDLIEDAVERLGRLLRLRHANRIRVARRVQLMATRASTGALAVGEDFFDLVARHRDDYGVSVHVIREGDQAGRERPG